MQRGAAEKRCRIMAFHRLKFCGPKVLKLCLSSCRCLQVRSHDKHGCCNLLSMRAGGRVLNGSLWDLHLIWKPTGQSFSNCRCKLARTSKEAGAEATPGQLVPQFGELAIGEWLASRFLVQLHERIVNTNSRTVPAMFDFRRELFPV